MNAVSFGVSLHWLFPAVRKFVATQCKAFVLGLMCSKPVKPLLTPVWMDRTGAASGIDVQQDSNIAPEASFALSVKKNPEKGQPRAAGLHRERKPDYPDALQEHVRDRRFARETPEFLDYAAAEFVMVGARKNPELGYGLDLDPEKEDARTAGIIKDLKMARSRHPVEPLLKGQWR